MQVTTSRTVRSLAAAIVAAGASLAAGCTTQPAGDGAETGSLVVPLTQPGPSGELYHLAGAVIDVTPRSGQTSTFDASGDDAVLTIALPPGIVTLQLRDGWSLEKSTDGGATFAPVPAVLGSANPTAVRVLASQPAFVRFDFLIRNPGGTLNLSFGVVPDPRQLAGGVVVESATGDLANYAAPGNRQLDFAVFFQLTSLDAQTLADGTQQRVYTASAAGASPGPLPQAIGAVATEFYNDALGLLAGAAAADLTGGLLTYTVAARPDGAVELSGQMFGATDTLSFGPHVIGLPPAIGPDGLPEDVFFYDSESPFTLTTPEGTLAGVLRVRHLVPGP